MNPGAAEDDRQGDSTDAELSGNAAVVSQYFTDLLAGDVAAVERALAPTCRVWVAGQLASSGWHTRAEYLAGLAASGGGQNALFASAVEFRFGFVTAQGDQVCVEAESRADLTSGAVYNNQYHYFFRVQDGLIVVIKEYFDSLHVADVFPQDRAAGRHESNLSGTTPGWAGPS